MTERPDLIERVADLGSPYGLERSVKMIAGALLADRYLLSLHRSALGMDPLRRLLSIVEPFAMPRDEEREVAAALETADVVHFGYERDETSEILKVYFEYAERTRAALEGRARPPVRVHIALKWDWRRPKRRTWTHYTWSGCRTRGEIEARLIELSPSTGSPAFAHSMALLARAASLAATEEMLMMEVDEPGNPRRSWDINLYNSELTVGDVADLLEVAGGDFGLSLEQTRGVFAPQGAAALGHVSGGASRSGAEFLTIYYGVEAHGAGR